MCPLHPLLQVSDSLYVYYLVILYVWLHYLVFAIHIFGMSGYKKYITECMNLNNKYFPIHLAPILGQLVPMAVPLGKPRMDSGLALAPDDNSGHPVSTTRPSVPPVTAAANVAMVAMMAEGGEIVERRPDLGIQVRQIY